MWRLPATGVVRVHRDPAALLERSDTPGTNRFDDPRPNTTDRYRVRYAATTLRGCLLESLDWLRPDPAAAAREAAVDDDSTDDAEGPGGPGAAGDQLTAVTAQAIGAYLTGRRVATIVGPDLGLVSADDPVLQAHLDREPAVQALLASEEGRAALAPGAGPGARRPRLDGAAVRLSTPLGRDLTRAMSLALYDRAVPPDGIHYRSRHDDAEDCWALYEHAPVTVTGVVPLDPTDPGHRAALHAVAEVWDLPLPAQW